MLDFGVRTLSAPTFIESLLAEFGLFYPHLGVRLRIRAELRAEQLRCISQPRRFPHVAKTPPQRLLTKQAQAERRDQQCALQCQREAAWQEAVSITASQEGLPVVRCPAWLTRTGFPTLLGSVVDMLGHGYVFWASTVETFYCREFKLGDPFPLPWDEERVFFTMELDRRVRAWIVANSTLGASALHKWDARDDLAPRLPQQALDSTGRRLLTPREMLKHWKT